MTKHIFRVPVDQKHFQDTIVKGKNYSELLPFLSDKDKGCLEVLATTSDTLRYWGSLPGTSNTKLFKLINVGDEILFYRNGRYIAVATIAYTTINPALARYSWEENSRQETWELVYFLRATALISVETNVLNSEWNFKKGPVMGFSKLRDETAQAFLSKYGSVVQFLIRQGIIDR